VSRRAAVAAVSLIACAAAIVGVTLSGGLKQVAPIPQRSTLGA